jgi:hypothetical protein
MQSRMEVREESHIINSQLVGPKSIFQLSCGRKPPLGKDQSLQACDQPERVSHRVFVVARLAKLDSFNFSRYT